MTFDLDLVYYMLAFIGAGILSGFFSGLFGIGGGIFRIPIFVFLFGHFGADQAVVMHVSAGTSLALVAPGSFMASRKMHKMGRLDLNYFKSWAVACVVGVLIGLVILNFVTTFYLELLFIIFLFLVSLYVGFVKDTVVITPEPPKRWAKWITSGFIGGFSVLIGIGGGAFTGPILKACGAHIKNAIATSGATALIIGFVGAIGAIITGWGVPGRPVYCLGYVDMIVFIVMLPTVMIFAPLGAKVANHLDKTILKRVYSVFLLIMSLYMLTEILGLD